LEVFVLFNVPMRDKILFLLTFACTLATTASAQQPETEAVFTSDSKLVELHATVTGPDGSLLTDLPRSVFKVFENDVPQEIKVFRHEDAPVSLGLIIDNSASMTDKHARVAAALLTLVKASNPGDEEFVVEFNQTPKVVQDFTQDTAQLADKLKRADASGQTALRDALSMGIAHVARLGKNDRKVLVIVTDGEDNSSSIDLARLTREAEQRGVLVYAIGLLNDSNERESARARKDLDTLTAATGGEAFYPKDLDEVDGIAKHVAHDLRNQYTIAYIPTDQHLDGTFRRIKLVVTSPPDAVAKTREGYYASSHPES
jgi:Ca-activated chloride channel family protein